MRKLQFPISVLPLLLGSSLALAGPPPAKPVTPPKPKAAAAPVLTASKSAKKGPRWTAATPDQMLAQAAERAKGKGADALAAMTIVMAMAERASPGAARHALELIGEGKGELAETARWLAAELSPTSMDEANQMPHGLVTHMSILGPFQDAEGRVKQKDIDESQPSVWADSSATYSWGVYDVRWRPVLSNVSPRGVPLDLLLSPRKETCAYVASRITLTSAQPVVVHVASSGAVRLIWDGQEAGVAEDIQEGAMFDRLASRVDATAGDHLVAARVCAGAIDDAGRVRIRLSTPEGKPLEQLASSTDLKPLASLKFAKLSAKPLVEPIVHALDLPAKPTMDAALDVAILRTKGGVEDLRSPRAPGLIESVARSADASPDTLAMAGWISPFGAERSGSLNLARDRATKEGDAATLDFTTRRIVAARVDAGLADWAMATMTGSAMATATDAEARLLRAHVRGEVGGDAAKRVELTELLAVSAELGDRTPAAIWDETARVARSFDPNVERDARARLAVTVPERFDLDYVRASMSVSGAAVTRAVADMVKMGGLTSSDEIDDLGAVLIAAGQKDAARSFLVTSASYLAPNVSAVYRGLSESLFESQNPQDRANGEIALGRARDLEPGDARLRAELALRSKSTTRPKERDERWLVDAQTLLAKAKADPAKKGEVADRQVYWLRAVTQHEDKRVSQLIQYGREIVIAPRTQEELYEPIPAEGDETEIIRARVHRASGDIAFAEEQKSDFGRPMIRWPDLKPGDIVEVAIRTWTAGPIGRRGDPPFFVLDYGGSPSTHPLLFNEVILDVLKQHPLAVDVLNGKPDRIENTDDGARTITHFIWDHPVQLADEPLAPKGSEIMPTLVISSFATWDEFRTWYNGAVAGFTEPDEQVRHLAAELTKGKTTRDEKLHALFDFVSDDIRYVNYVSGEWWLPNRPQQLLARRQGDCDDKALLLITLLKSVGIDATEVLIQTRYTAQPSLLLSKKAAIPLFDHGIAYIPAKGGSPAIWLDATSPQSRLGPVPSMDTRTFALFATEGPPEMVATPHGKPEDYGVDGQWTLSMHKDGSVDLDASEIHRGDHAFFLRTALREADARAPWVEQNLVAGWIPQVEVDKQVEFQPDLPNGEARVHYKAKSAAFGRVEGDDLVVTLAPSSTLTSTLAALPTRTLPVALPPSFAPSRLAYTMRLVAPEGMRPGDLPPGGDEAGGEFGRAKLEVALDPKDPRTIVLTRSVMFDLERIPVEKYAAWRAWLSRVDSLLHRSVRFVKTSAKSDVGGAR